MSGRKILLVDGYNVIRSTMPYASLSEVDLDSARTALVSDVAAFADREWDATVVFDGGGNVHSKGQPHEVAGVTVIFSPFGTDADAVIESLARQGRDAAISVSVVTSDAQLQWAVMGGTVGRQSAAGFSTELRAGASEWREYAPAGERRTQLSDRIDPATRDVLSRWARGED